MTLDDLVAIEAIRRLKARYCRTIDAKDWLALADVFASDAQLRHGDTVVEGRDAIVGVISTTLADAPTAHAAHTPVIDVVDAAHATGNWGAIYCRIGDPPSYGIYDEVYTRGADGEWRISRTELVDTSRPEDPSRG
jgi:ketosteroid isomerase-like protein